jgi:hypothetical protein
MMIDEVIYGVILNANTDIFEKDPPVNASKKLNAPPLFCSNHEEK